MKVKLWGVTWVRERVHFLEVVVVMLVVVTLGDDDGGGGGRKSWELISRLWL